ncbi:hypothetical protein BG000_000897 [Podila horticola]|nr:hypothetical protein BG000_000897 [Podila horticola]
MVAPALMDQQQRRSSSALESKSVNRHSLPVQRTRTKSMHLPSFSNTHPLVVATPCPSSPPSSPILEAAKKRPRPPLVISMPPSQNNDLTRSTTASTASSTPSVLHRVKRSFSRNIKSGRVADKPDAFLSYESYVKHNPISPSSITVPVLSPKRSSITSLPPLSPSSTTSPRTSSMSIHHQHPHHSHYHYHAQSISLDPISEEQTLSETKKSGKLKRWQSKSSAKLKKWLHIDSPSKSSSSDHNDNTITPSTRRDSNATTCSSCVSHEDSRSSSIGSSPNTSMPPSPALSARSVLSSFSSRPVSLPPPAKAIILPPPVPARRSSLRATSRSEGRPVSTPGRIPPRSSSLRVSRRSLLGRTLSTEIPPVPESPEEASFYAALAQVAAEVDEAIAAASEESESESTCSVRSRSSETLLLSEDEQVAHDKQDSSSLRPSLSPYFVSPETNVPIPWSCSDVLLDRPAALDLQDIEAMEEVQAMVTGQFEEYEQSTTIMSFDVHGNNSVQDIDLPSEKTQCVDITLMTACPTEISEADIPTVYQVDKGIEEEAPSTDTFEAVPSLQSDDEEDVLDQAQVAPMEVDHEDLFKSQQDDDEEDFEGECAGELLDADNVEEEVHVLSREVMPIEGSTPEAMSTAIDEVMDEKQDEAVATTLCGPKPILPSIQDIAQTLFDEMTFNPVVEKESTPVEEEAEPILVATAEDQENDQEVVVDTVEVLEEATQEYQVEEDAVVQESLPVEPVLELVDGRTLFIDLDEEKKEEEVIVETAEDLQVMNDSEEPVQEILSVIEEDVAVVQEVAPEPTADDVEYVETLIEESERVNQEFIKEAGSMDEPLTANILVESEDKEEIKEVLVEEALELACVDELAIIVSHEDSCQVQDVAPPTMDQHQGSNPSPLPSPEFRPVQVEDDLDIIPLVLSTVDVIPEPTVEGSVVIQEDTLVQAHAHIPVAVKGVVWEALQELHPPAVSPWKRASRSPWLSASFWLHGQ